MSADASTRLFRLRAGRALVLGVLAMAAVAWIVSLPAVLFGLAGGIPAALLMPRFARARTPILATLAVTLAAALAGSFLVGHGSTPGRLGAGLVAAVAVGPWSVVLGFILWVRAHFEDRD